jgi:hypothetical protein
VLRCTCTGLSTFKSYGLRNRKPMTLFLLDYFVNGYNILSDVFLQKLYEKNYDFYENIN